MSGRSRRLNTSLFNKEYEARTTKHLGPVSVEPHGVSTGDMLEDIQRDIHTIKRVIQGR